MLQRQKNILAVVAAIIVIGMFAHFATESKSDQAPADTKENESMEAVVARKLARAKECEALRKENIKTLTQQKYDDMLARDRAPRGPARRLPDSLEQFQARITRGADKMLNTTERQLFDNMMRNVGECKYLRKRAKALQENTAVPPAGDNEEEGQ